MYEKLEFDRIQLQNQRQIQNQKTKSSLKKDSEFLKKKQSFRNNRHQNIERLIDQVDKSIESQQEYDMINNTKKQKSLLQTSKDKKSLRNDDVCDQSVKLIDIALTYQIESTIEDANKDISILPQKQISNFVIRNLSAVSNIIKETENRMSRTPQQDWKKQSYIRNEQDQKESTQGNSECLDQSSRKNSFATQFIKRNTNFSKKPEKLEELTFENKKEKQLIFSKNFFHSFTQRNESSQQNKNIKIKHHTPEQKSRIQERFLTPLKDIAKQGLQGKIQLDEIQIKQMHHSIGLLGLYQGMKKKVKNLDQFKFNHNQYYAFPSKQDEKQNFVQNLVNLQSGTYIMQDKCYELDGKNQVLAYLTSKDC